MDSRIIMLVMSLVTFVAYPFLSADGRKQVAPLTTPGATPIDETEEQQEADDDEDPVMMEDEDDEVADLQLGNENQYIRAKASDVQIGKENEQVKKSASDSQISNEDEIEEDY